MSRHRTGRRFLIVTLVIALVLASATAAFAFFTGSGSGSGAAKAGALSAPTDATATPASPTQINVSWTLPGTQASGAQYRVQRTSPTSATVCTVSAPTSSCSDTSLSAATSYNYSVVAILSNWQTTAITVSATTFAADGSGTLTTPTTSVTASSTGNTITFTYTAAAGGMSNGSVTVAVPSGWTAPSTTGSNAGFTTASTGTVSVASQTITVSGVTLAGGGTFAIVYGSQASGGPGATATSATGAQTWQAQQKSTSGGTLTNLATSPSITVNAALAADGSGTLTTPTTSVIASSTGNTITFTYTAASGGMSNGSVTVAVPSGWTAPSTTGSNAGFTTASTGTVSVASQTITVSGVTLAGGGTFTIVYGSQASGGPGATATSSTGAQTWQAQQKSTSGGTLTNLATSPSITVDAALKITTVTRNGGNRKYTFSGTGASGSSAVTVTICAVNSFPCTSPVATAVTGTSPPAAWTSGQSGSANLSADTLYYAEATQGAATSAVFPFYSTNTTPGVTAGVMLANGSSGTLGRADATDTVTITYGVLMDADSFCSSWSNGSVQSSSASVQIVQNAANDTLNNLTVSGCTFNFGSIALNRDYVSSTVTFATSTVSWDPSTFKLTIALGGGTGQNTSVTATAPSYTASTSIKDQFGAAMTAGPFPGAGTSRF